MKNETTPTQLASLVGFVGKRGSMIKISYKKALALWFCFSAGIALMEVFRNGGDALIIDIITPSYWMLCMVIFLIFNTDKQR